jgi:transcriptional regulator with XRE-family HTH domain
MILRDPADLARLMTELGLTPRRLASRVGLGKSSIDRLMRGASRSTRANAASEIETVLRVPSGTLFRPPADGEVRSRARADIDEIVAIVTERMAAHEAGCTCTCHRPVAA